MGYRMLSILVSAMLAAVLVTVAGCGQQEGHVVAQVGEREIMIEEIDGYINRAGARFPSAEKELEARRALLDSLINQNLLIIGAYEHNLENHDEVLRVVEGEKIKFLLDVLFDKEIISKSTPSEAEMKDWYVRMGEEIKASHIVVDSESTAQEILQKLRDGDIFEELAIQHSVDPSVKRNQGDLGWFTWGTMLDSFQEAAFRLQPGEISAPVKTIYGYHIIKVADRRKVEHRASYAEMKNSIRSSIMERRQRQLMRDYAQRLKDNYPITVEQPTCQFVLNKLEFLYPETIAGRPRWRNNIDPMQLDLAEKDLVLGKYTGGQITLGEYLANINRLPENRRPDFDKYDSLSEVIFQMELMDIMAVEARSMGLEDSKKYKDHLRRFKELAMADVLRNDTIPFAVEVDEGEVQEYYDTHLDEFTTPLRFQMLEIQVADKAQAETYMSTIRSEEEFKRIASAETLRPGKRRVAGDLGTVFHDQYPELYDAAAELTRGRLAGPIEASEKYSVIWVKQRLEPEVQDFGLAKRRIIDRLTKDKGDALYGQWIADMKKRIQITVRDNVLLESVDMDKYIQADSTAEAG